jgi:diguanylate cyclase (GGDEF)-like protein
MSSFLFVIKNCGGIPKIFSVPDEQNNMVCVRTSLDQITTSMLSKIALNFGHHIGDQLLIHVVDVCRAQLKEGMLFARYGGEEFVLAMKGCTVLEGETFANQLRKAIEAEPLITIEGVISVTFSSGVAEAANASNETLYLLLNKADKALYAAKREGRNRVQVYGG